MNLSKYTGWAALVGSYLCVFVLSVAQSETEDVQSQQKFKIEGKVGNPFSNSGDQEWLSKVRVIVDGGQHLAFIRSDGTFSVNNVPSGSYLVEVAHPVFVFEPVRVDITSKGKIRARRLNNIKTSSVQTIAYPLKFKAKGRANYFQMREQWRITDMLMSPMVLMMVAPLLMIMVLPKLINTNDPETQKEMQNQMKMLNPKQNMPEMSELLTSWLGGGSTKPKAVKPKPARRR